MNNKVVYNLQAARGIATIVVVLAHSNMFLGEHIFHGVFSRVRWPIDLFFVMSGFIIYYTNQNLVNNFSQLKKYFLRRFARVYPIHWISLSIILLSYYFLVVFDAYDYPFSWSVIAKSFLLWPTYPEGMPINPVTWTLTLEVFFYVVFGVAGAMGRRFSIVVFLVWLLAIVSSIKFDYTNAFLHLCTDTINIEFIYGCLIAVFINKFKFSRKVYLMIFYLGTSLIIASWYYVWKMPLFGGKLGFVFVGIPCVFIVYSLIKLETNQSSILKKIFIFIGDASYSIYLCHLKLSFFLIYFLDKLISDKMIMFAFISSSSFVFGSIFYLMIEKPLVEFSRNFINRKYRSGNYEKLKNTVLFPIQC